MSSGTAAIHCALAAVRVGLGDEVIIPATAPVMTALPVLAIGGIPVLVDTEPGSFGISMESLKKAITERTKCVISVPMWGYPTNTQAVTAMCHTLGLPIIEDAAQAIGTSTDGSPAGTSVDLGCFSTHEVKLISTGEGGFVLIADQDLANRVREYARYGMLLGSEHGSLAGRCGYRPGLNYKLSAMAASLGIAQLGKLAQRLAIRQAHAEAIQEVFRNDGDLLIPLEDTGGAGTANYYACILRLQGRHRGAAHAVAQSLKRRGVSTDYSEYDYRLLCEYPLFTPYRPAGSSQTLPNASRLVSDIVILPTHDLISEDDIRYMHTALLEALTSED